MILQNVILFPQAMIPLHIFEPRYRRMLRDVLEDGRVFALAMQRPHGNRERAQRIAGLGLVRACVTHDDGSSHLVLQGLCRVELTRTVRYRPYRLCEVRPLPPESTPGLAVSALSARLLELVRQRLTSLPKEVFTEFVGAVMSPNQARHATIDAFQKLLDHLNSISDPEQVADLVSATLLPDPIDRQLILETPDVEGRLRHLIRFLTRQVRRQQKEGPSP